jgi:uncharacterized protein (TIGR02453 family)
MNFEAAFKFLKDLGKNNDRVWFEKNKDRYLMVKDDFEGFVGELLHKLIAFDESLQGLEPKKLTFRIYRDVRFSKDKLPYKKNLSAAYSSSGKTMSTPGYYLHIEPGHKSFVGMGLYQPEPDKLGKIRQEIDYNGDKLAALFKDKKFRKYYSGFWKDDALKNAPKGYPKDHVYADWLRLKSFIVTHEFRDEEVIRPRFIVHVAEVMKAAKPLNDFLKDAVE